MGLGCALELNGLVVGAHHLVWWANCFLCQLGGDFLGADGGALELKPRIGGDLGLEVCDKVFDLDAVDAALAQGDSQVGIRLHRKGGVRQEQTAIVEGVGSLLVAVDLGLAAEFLHKAHRALNFLLDVVAAGEEIELLGGANAYQVGVGVDGASKVVDARL